MSSNGKLKAELEDAGVRVSAHNGRLNNYLEMYVLSVKLGDNKEAEKCRLLAHDELDLLLDAQIRAIVLSDKLNRAGGEE